MKYLKKFNESTDSELDYISDLFIEYADKWNLLEISGPSPYETPEEIGRHIYTIRRVGNRGTKGSILINMLFKTDNSIVEFTDSLGYDESENPPIELSKKFELDMEKFKNRLESIGYNTIVTFLDYEIPEYVIQLWGKDGKQD